MKKVIVIFLCALLIIPCGCKKANENSSAQIVYKITDLQKSDGVFMIFTNANDSSERGYISSQNLSYLYYGRKEDLDELSVTSNFCIAFDKTKRCREIHIFKVENESDIFGIERMLDSRGKYLCHLQINPNSSEYLTQKAEKYLVFHRGKYAVMCVGDNAEELKKSVLKFL